MSILLEQTAEHDVRLTSHGAKIYYRKNTKTIHRISGPAIEWRDGSVEYIVNGRYHRIDGPAVIDANGYKEWWIDGEHLSSEKEDVLNKWWDNKNENEENN